MQLQQTNPHFSSTEAAKFLGTTQPNLLTAVRVNKIKSLTEYNSLTELAEDWRANVLSRDAVDGLEVDTEGKTLNQLRAEREVIGRDMALLELQQMKDALLYKDAARKAHADIVGRIKNAFRSMPARKAPTLAAKYGIDAHSLLTDLDTMIREQLDSISEEIEL